MSRWTEAMRAVTGCTYGGCGEEPSADLDLPICDRHALKVYRTVAERVKDEARAARHASSRPKYGKAVGTIYYLQLGDRVKIGFTTNLEVRLKALPHERILNTRPGTMKDEREEQRRWKHLQTKGEWFRATPELMSHIAGLS